MSEEKFWLRVKELLKKKGMTQKELSRKLGLNDRAVESWVQKCNVPGTFDSYKIAQILGVTVEYLVTGNNKQIVLTSEGINETFDALKAQFLNMTIEIMNPSSSQQ